MRTIRVGTYNVHKCGGMDGRTSPHRIAEVIREFNPDIVGLQEVLSLEDGPCESNQAQYLADALSMHLAVGEVRRIGLGVYGNIVLSRFPVHGVCTFDLSAPGRERRGCVRSDIPLEGGPVLHLFNFHLGTDFLERRWQANRLLELELMRSKDLNGPRIVLGDFNEWTRGLVSQVLASEFRSAGIGIRRSYPGLMPLLHLDHIYYDEDLIASHAGVHRTMKSLVASDHLPLYADFALRGS